MKKGSIRLTNNRLRTFCLLPTVAFSKGKREGKPKKKPCVLLEYLSYPGAFAPFFRSLQGGLQEKLRSSFEEGELVVCDTVKIRQSADITEIPPGHWLLLQSHFLPACRILSQYKEKDTPPPSRKKKKKGVKSRPEVRALSSLLSHRHSLLRYISYLDEHGDTRDPAHCQKIDRSSTFPPPLASSENHRLRRIHQPRANSCST